ncbi:MAG: hypothetical protein A2798_02640 [Candidatus Levybacteria bacterium RIFCSPHIGHO2_01_FULL_37_17]|nr:MAG: hypothetical protein A2798_02640 [Candidatus Levybacteria bacterium RIFCSPHIGHO2_01_FULL_37_17]OGH36760.1 MAG: hypothetical protein A2959_00630 [Candidatus Levybacteria bacterium RIFCSPLOWO2_01_FULL_38_23]
MRETVLKFFSLLISKFAFAFIITTLLTGIILIPFVIKNTYKINQAPKPLLDIVPTKIITKTPTATPSPTLKPIPSNIIAPTSPPVVINNVAPGSGYNRQTVAISEGNFIVDIIAADLNTTRVIVDTASDSDCFDNCPVLPLSDYVSRSGGFAGINGTYFCPASYPSCAGKVNSFDLLVMNKNKYYFNSSNNVYSTNPAVIFYGNSVRFVGQALEWGRDTGVDAVISNFPLYVSGGNAVAQGGVRGFKSFIGNKGSTVYIGFVRNATAGETAKVLQALGLENAMGLDQGGSTALMYNSSYILGPGRGIPNAVLFVRK